MQLLPLPPTQKENNLSDLRTKPSSSSPSDPLPLIPWTSTSSSFPPPNLSSNNPPLLKPSLDPRDTKPSKLSFSGGTLEGGEVSISTMLRSSFEEEEIKTTRTTVEMATKWTKRRTSRRVVRLR